MSFTVNINPRLKSPVIWSTQNNQVHALNSIALIKRRTMKGIDAKGNAFKRYSTKGLYISLKGARLKPKGGRLSRSGKSMYFAGGYKEYKQKSRLGNIQTAEVDLVLSGILMNSIQVLNSTRSSYTIGLASQSRSYGYHVNKKREFLGLTRQEQEIIVEAAAIDMRRNLR